MLVVDTQNHRVQKFTASGEYISGFGEFGTDDGQFNYPWGVGVDPHDGAIYVSDWRNDRLQKFDSDGEHLWTVGSRGRRHRRVQSTCWCNSGPSWRCLRC